MKKGDSAFGVFNTGTWTGDHLVERCATEREAVAARYRWMREMPACRFTVKPLVGRWRNRGT